MNEALRSSEVESGRWQLVLRVGLVAGLFALVVCAGMAWNYSRRLVKDPLEAPAYQKLKAELAHTQKDASLDPAEKQRKLASLKEQIRATDLELRRQYFRQLRAIDHGALMLAVGAILALLCVRAAATLRRRLPAPTGQATPRDSETATRRNARWAIAGLAAVMLGLGGWLTIGFHSDVPFPGQPQAAAETAEPAAAAAPASAPAPAAGGLPTDQEMAANWPRFRGPGGTGISAEKGLLTSWDVPSGKGIVWKTPVPLPGNNSVVVWGDQLFLSGATAKARQVFCFDAKDGKLLWAKDAPGTPESTRQAPKLNDDTGFAAATTATDGRRVFAIFANGDLAAFDFQGNTAWSRSLGMPKNDYGLASSLATYKNLLLVQFDQGSDKDGLSRVMGLDTATGKTAWETRRKVPASWSTPIVLQHGGRDQLITTADPWVIAYNPANGEELWRAECLKQDIGPSPTAADGVVYAVNNFPQLTAIRADGQGTIAKDKFLWIGEDGLPDTCSPLATDRYVLLLSSGTLTCYDAKSGKLLWEKDFEGEFYASPGMADGHVYLVAREGKCWTIDLGPEGCKEIGTGNLGEDCVSSPAFHAGRIYLRGAKHLFAIGAK
jgi:outer membrane protein assembly factor BamB